MNSDSMEKLVISEIDALYSYAMILTRNQDDAANLVQDTFVRALTIPAQQSNAGNIQTRLSQILRSLWLDQLRGGHIEPLVSSMDQSKDAKHSFVETSVKRELSKAAIEVEVVQRAIQNLPLNLREVILLREYGDLSYSEIADILACPIETVTSRLAVARAELKVLLRSLEPKDSDQI